MAGPFASEGMNQLAKAVEAYAEAAQAHVRQVAAGIAAVVEQHEAEWGRVSEALTRSAPFLAVSPEENQPHLGDARPGSWCPCSDSPACEDDMECQENQP